MELTVCLQVVDVENSFSINENTNRISFNGKAVCKVVDDEERIVKTYTFTLANYDEVHNACMSLGKVTYAQLEQYNNEILIWFVKDRPFKDEDYWREDLLLSIPSSSQTEQTEGELLNE